MESMADFCSDFMAWCNMDKGYARKLTPWGSQKVMRPLGPLAERVKLAEATARVGWSETKMKKVLGENWLAYLEKIFGN
jgi:membrane dipeptidase